MKDRDWTETKMIFVIEMVEKIWDAVIEFSHEIKNVHQ